MISRRLSLTTLLVRDYDEAIAYVVHKLGFGLMEDTPLGGSKRWDLLQLKPPRASAAPVA